MSVMKAIRGRIVAMYVKFCSGPTPRYTPEGFTVRSREAATVAMTISFDRRLSGEPEFDRK